ncbi:MAG TPA: hypothetical protein VN364_08860 [Bellilinea sp.]|nr:hypothetical protein [Bellilinea sp.]
MTAWNLTEGDPLHLTLACDPRFGNPDYLNDHIWELQLSGGTPSAVGVQTTYGLRARLMRLFPRFQRNDNWINDPADFSSAPRVTHLVANYLGLEFSPFNGVEVFAEYWVPASQVISGRFTFTNAGKEKEKFIFEWLALLSHLGEGSGMAVVEAGISHHLEGKTNDLCPVCIMTGGPQAGSGPYAGLAFDIELARGESRTLTWAMATLEDAEASLALARQTTARSWDAEIARNELVNDSQFLSISTGDADWDAALALSQKAANGLFVAANEHLPFPSFVLARVPEQGYSLRGDGLDYNHLWNGQTALDAWYLTSILGFTQPDRCAGLIENFIHSRREDGGLDWKPGLAGQRGKRLAQPLLADSAWQVYSHTGDSDWVKRVYPALYDSVRCWFTPESDRDQDGFPEWEHPFQIGLDDAPIFHPWLENTQGVDPDVVESPSLAAMLVRECAALIKMAQLQNRTTDVDWLAAVQKKLITELRSNWSEERGSYSYRDAHIQDSPSSEELLSIHTTGTFPVLRKFDSPRRLLLHFHPQDEMTRLSLVFIHGDSPDGPVSEEATPRNIHWLHATGRYTTRNHFSRLVEVSTRAMLPGDRCEVSTIDFTSEDISLLSPLWSGVPDEQQARRMVEHTIMQRYLQPYGLPVCPPDRCSDSGPVLEGVSMIWNQLVAQGMVDYGYRKEAAEVLTRLMQAVTARLKTDHAFWSAYHSADGRGQGERNTLNGLAPLGLFLKVLGLEKISAEQVIVDGNNPFSRPVTVQYRGTKVEFLTSQIRVTFAGGQSVMVQGDGRQEISLP